MKKGQILKEKELSSCNIFSIKVVTNTPKGGDSGYGGFTSFKLKDEGNTNWDIFIDGEYFYNPSCLCIDLRGDTEAITLANALIFAGKSLKKQMKKNSNEVR